MSNPKPTPYEKEIFSDAIQEILIPQLQRSQRSLPQDLKRTVELLSLLHNVDSPTNPQIEAIRTESAALIFALLQETANLPQPVQQIVRTITAIQKKIRQVGLPENPNLQEQSTSSQEQPSLPQRVEDLKKMNTPDLTKVQEYKTEIQPVIAKHQLTAEKLDQKLTEQQKFDLIFGIFQTKAAAQGKNAEELMDLHSERLAAAQALHELTSLRFRKARGLFSVTSPGQRNPARLQNGGLSLYQKYLAQIKK